MRVLRAEDRFVTRADGITTAHCFSFGAHFDQARSGVGPLLACNDERLEPGSGYASHRHRDVEIVTWVLSGTLTHEDSAASRHDLAAGAVQRLSAGAGVLHTERNGQPHEPLRFVQMWLRPDREVEEPTYACEVSPLRTGAWAEVVGGGAALGVGTSGAVLRVAQLEPGAELVVPEALQGFVFVATGSVDVDGIGTLGAGDSLLLSGNTPQVGAREPVELLAWELPADQEAAR